MEATVSGILSLLLLAAGASATLEVPVSAEIAPAPGYTGLVYCAAEGCAPCRRMTSIVERLRSAGLPVDVVDVQQDQASSRRWRPTRLPATIVLENGREIDRRYGALSQQQLLRLMPATARPCWERMLQ